MSVNFIPELQTMAAVQIAIPILNNPDIRSLIDRFSVTYRPDVQIEVCNAIENAAMEKILCLVVAPTLRKELRDCIMDMFSHIIECKYSYSMALTECNRHVNQHFKFFWKCDGTIDQENTLKSLVEDQNLYIKERFVLASSICLIEDALSLYKSMVQDTIRFCPLEVELYPVIKLMIEMFEEGSSQTKISDWILDSPVLQNNVSVLRYVVHMLPFEKQRPYLLSTALKEDINTDVMAFCLSHLRKNDQETVFKNSPKKVLQCMLTWPYQNMFLSVADHLWAYLSKENFCSLLSFILNKIMCQKWSNFRLIELLKDFWFESPTNFKEHAKKQRIFRTLTIVLNSDRHTFPRRELEKACIVGLEEFLSLICSE